MIEQKGIPKGHIVVAACKDGCISHMSRTCYDWFKSMGSRAIKKLKFRMGFAFIGISGEYAKVKEKRAKHKKNSVRVHKTFRNKLQIEEDEEDIESV